MTTLVLVFALVLSLTASAAEAGPPLDFARDVAPILEARCAVCHACYDAPCQAVFTSHEGVTRGASQDAVYQTSRLRAAEPTRLGVDADGDAAWRARGFFSVLGEGGDPQGALLLRMLALGSEHPFAPGAKLPASVGLDIGRALSCPKPSEFDAYAKKHPEGGMPYGTARLEPEEVALVTAWVAAGAPAAAPAPAPAHPGVAPWEAFLNGTSTTERVVARYLYEHWFVSHLHFDDEPAGPFYRIVRSRTAPGTPADEIATRRPYDDPGSLFWYRLVRVEGTIVHKTHIVYEIGPAKLARLRQLFLAGDWQATKLPSYDRDASANPFVAFAEIPARSRYQFLLDDARHFVMTFIRGPVCRGQVAVDVIEDHFFVAFLDPDRDLSVTHPEFLREHARLLDLPAENVGPVYVPGDLFASFDVKQGRYLAERKKLYDRIDPEKRGPALDWIWDGEGHDRDALLTVFRNFDNAEVVFGFVGALPKTSWVMDYPIFERIYYDLVAGYDVFGAVGHQISTRLYMDHLRMQSENLFLGFLPPETRKPLRDSWYVGATKQLDYFLVNRQRALDHGTQVAYTPGGDPKRELIEQLLARSPGVAGPPDLLNRCANPPCARPGANQDERAAERELQRVSAVTGPWVQHLPEVSLLRVRVDPSGAGDLVYSLVRNAAHTNVAFMFGEDERRLPADDTVTVIRGPFGSYPNFFFEVKAPELHGFVEQLRGVADAAGMERLAARFGVRRTHPRFWAFADWLRGALRASSPSEAGLYDLNRYENL